MGGKLKAVTDTLGNRAEYAYDNKDRLIHICQKGKAKEADRETFYERDPVYSTMELPEKSVRIPHFQQGNFLI